MKKSNKKETKKQTEKITAQSGSFFNYNKNGQPGRDFGNVSVANDHKNWGLLRCVSPNNSY